MLYFIYQKNLWRAVWKVLWYWKRVPRKVQSRKLAINLTYSSNHSPWAGDRHFVNLRRRQKGGGGKVSKRMFLSLLKDEITLNWLSQSVCSHVGAQVIRRSTYFLNKKCILLPTEHLPIIGIWNFNSGTDEDEEWQRSEGNVTSVNSRSPKTL